jgi:DNA-binding PadR family transcriptional regulator
VLRRAQLVTEERAGTRRMYEANAEGLEMLRRYLEQFWGDALSSFAAAAKKQSRGRRKS